MKKITMLVLSVAALSAGSAMAADMPVKAVYKAPEVACCDWTGIYIGGHVGGAWSRTSFRVELPTLAEAFNYSINANNVIAGGHAGLQGQWGNLVLGVEVSFDATRLRGEIISPEDTINRRYVTQLDQIFTAVGRVGLANCDWLFYLKGGFASARLQLDKFRATDNLQQSTSSGRVPGLVVGGGVERAWGHWIGGVDVSYMDFNPSDRLNTEVNGFVTHNYRSIDPTVLAVQARLSYKFGSAVVAKY